LIDITSDSLMKLLRHTSKVTSQNRLKDNCNYVCLIVCGNSCSEDIPPCKNLTFNFEAIRMQPPLKTRILFGSSFAASVFGLSCDSKVANIKEGFPMNENQGSYVKACEVNMYYSHGIIIVIAVSVSIVLLWFIGCFLWNCLCCECCCDFKNKIYRNPIRPRPSIISIPRRSFFSLERHNKPTSTIQTQQHWSTSNAINFNRNEVSRI
jgi:hypothetical protein